MPDPTHRAEPHALPLVVLVEDDISTLALLADIADDAGWAVRTCRALGQLRRELRDVKPSLIILDDDLPDGRGGDLVRALRADPRSADVPLVVCTAATAARRAEIREIAPVVVKPFRIGEIERVLDAAAQRHRSRLGASVAG